MKIDYTDHYGKEYYTHQKTYTDHNGVVRKYTGPSLTWSGFDLVADAVIPLVPGKSLLDIGCSAGDLATRFLDKGYDAYGVDVSEYAIQNTVEKMRGRTALLDITTTPDVIDPKWPKTYDLIVSTDLLEHLYQEDLDKTFTWMKGLTNRWMFFCVCVAPQDSDVFVLKKGEVVPKQYEGMAVAGHVNVQSWKYWARFFTKNKLKIRWDLMYILQIGREANEPWKQTPGWNLGTTWILEHETPNKPSRT
jgi:SAM-dependent methyltransferase